MRSFSKTIFLALLNFAGQCSASEPTLGKTVAEAVQMLGTELSSDSMIVEPPAVARGFDFRLRNGDEVQIFIKRGQVPLTFEGGGDLNLYRAIEVKGVRRVGSNGEITCVGSEIVWFYDCAKPQAAGQQLK
ncbi:hypothetical protein [Pseudoduganella violaceinigra]|uniref:hypothetical protein n=1 Tax=Pseudoduganella violaceinigra TaxID=246602 RepID=UPI0012B59003|nr:hypothetical protein [Pseudoduganella violaceinigra]